jgi:dienelactone hydrolase
VPTADRAELETGLKELQAAIDKLAGLPKEPGLPDVQIYHKAVDWALRYNEFFSPKEIATAKELLKQGLARASALAEARQAKKPEPWNATTGLLVRAYQSEIDNSVQPYGLVIPADYKPGDGKKYPLHFWCHGRGEKLTELAFITDRQKNPGEFVPPGAIVCHLYGRYCNANKFAGQSDLFEALKDIMRVYLIDEQRLVIRGFSMGGAACWQFATHFPGLWAAAAPGAGFAETAEFFKVFAPGKEAPPAWEQKLWRWYDCTTMAANLANTTTVAYSGEIDGQKQAADIMVKYAAQEGITFPHIIGPKTGHKYHTDSKPEIDKLIDAAMAKGREEFPRKARFVTYSLIYPGIFKPIRIIGLEKHWEKAEVATDLGDDGTLRIKVENVISFGVAQLARAKPAVQAIEINGQKVYLGELRKLFIFRKQGGEWREAMGMSEELFPTGRKNDGVCGPIDHAFMSKFVFIRPTGKALNAEIGSWAKAEMDHAITAWRQVFRGDVEVVDDTEWLKREPSEPDRLFTEPNIVLWGDPSSNKVLAKIADKLPLKWDASTLEFRGQKFDAAHHAPILIYPNPLNPGRYVVLNSCFTFREAAALNNSDQTPKLPDWAIVDLRTPPGPKWPGKIVDAGFFDEEWK